MRGEKVSAHQLAHHRSGSKIEHHHAQQSEYGMCRVHLSKLASGDAFFNQATKVPVNWPKVLAHNPFELGSRTHGFALDEARIVRMRGDEIEIAVHKSEETVARSGVWSRRCVDDLAKLAEEVLEHSSVKLLFIAKVVVEHGLVCMRGR